MNFNKDKNKIEKKKKNHTVFYIFLAASYSVLETDKYRFRLMSSGNNVELVLERPTVLCTSPNTEVELLKIISLFFLKGLRLIKAAKIF